MILVSDPDFELRVGDALEQLRTLPAESVDMCVTSPPYWGLRDYQTGSWDGGDPNCDHKRPERKEVVAQHSGRKDNPSGSPPQIKDPTFFGQTCGKCGATRQDQQLGLEATPDLYVQNMVEVFREVRRVLKAHGSCWVNLGDSYAGGKTGRADEGRLSSDSRPGVNPAPIVTPTFQRVPPPGFKPKDLVGIPWRVAFALQADGWYLRSDIVWSKPNPMPESVTDRPTKAHEYVFLLSKGPRYFFDQEAVREGAQWRRWGTQDAGKYAEHPTSKAKMIQALSKAEIAERYGENPSRNVRSVWEIATHPYPEAHFATYPPELVRRCILAGSSERGVCSVCGKPWERVTSTEFVQHRKGGKWQERQQDERGSARSPAYSANGTGRNEVRTTGWRPSCDHDQAPVPATVLDPFLGSGTTALVAREQGRRCVGIELSREYAELAARRLSQLSLLAEPYPETTEGKGSSDESHSPQSSLSSDCASL